MKHAVAVCDILGFSELVEQHPADSVAHDYLERLRKALYFSVHQEQFPTEAPSLQAVQEQSSLGVAWFSDTILIYTVNDTEESLRALISSLGWLLFQAMVQIGIRLRCGVSYDEAYMDAGNSVYVGQPIIEAYRLERAQAWSGGALTPEMIARLPEYARSGVYWAEWCLVPYEVPLKGGETVRTLAIDWTVGAHYGFDLRWSKSEKEPSEGEWQQRPDVCAKWYNTRLFHDRVCRFCGEGAGLQSA